MAEQQSDYRRDENGKGSENWEKVWSFAKLVIVMIKMITHFDYCDDNDFCDDFDDYDDLLI